MMLPLKVRGTPLGPECVKSGRTDRTLTQKVSVG
jgi:hypothetical protein